MLSDPISVEGPPDPNLTANLYCADRLDDVVRRVVEPFWGQVRNSDPEGQCTLWLLRYRKRGEHLKIRLHGPEDLAPHLRQPLETLAEAYLAELGPAESESAKSIPLPPIDVEDRLPEPHADRSFTWTHYVRSPICLGAAPFLHDDLYAARLTACLGAGCQRLLELIRQDKARDQASDTGALRHSARQSNLFKAVLSGLAVEGVAPQSRASYLIYHRDWLMRYALLRTTADTLYQGGLGAHLERHTRQNEKSLPTLQQAANTLWREGVATDPSDLWCESLRRLLAHVAPLCADPDYHIDPFASEPVFPVIFKVFHGLANQLGLKLLDEMFAFHLLAQSVLGEEATWQVRFTPFEVVENAAA